VIPHAVSGEPGWLPPVAPRAYASTVHITDVEAEVSTGERLSGGWGTTRGAELHPVVRTAEELDPRNAVQVPA